MRRKTSLTLMGGIDHVKFAYNSAKVIRRQVAELEPGGQTNFILARMFRSHLQFSPSHQGRADAAEKAFKSYGSSSI